MDIDIGQVRERDAVGDHAPEPELPLARVQADYAGGLADEPLDDLPGPSLRPVRILRKEPVHLTDVDPSRFVVELVAAWKLTPHYFAAAARSFAFERAFCLMNFSERSEASSS
jgi:hypothetical protein